MMYKLLASIALGIIFLQILPSKLNAQANFNIASNETSMNGQVFTYSIGEMALVSTISTSNFIITQGFLQPIHIPSVHPGNENGNLFAGNLDIKVYPNPTEDIVFIDFGEDYHFTNEISLLDNNGKVVLSAHQIKQISDHKISLDLFSLSMGTYFLLIQIKDKNDKLGLYNYKIQKVN